VGWTGEGVVMIFCRMFSFLFSLTLSFSQSLALSLCRSLALSHSLFLFICLFLSFFLSFFFLSLSFFFLSLSFFFLSLSSFFPFSSYIESLLLFPISRTHLLVKLKSAWKWRQHPETLRYYIEGVVGGGGGYLHWRGS